MSFGETAKQIKHQKCASQSLYVCVCVRAPGKYSENIPFRVNNVDSATILVTFILCTLGRSFLRAPAPCVRRPLILFSFPATHATCHPFITSFAKDSHFSCRLTRSEYKNDDEKYVCILCVACIVYSKYVSYIYLHRTTTVCPGTWNMYENVTSRYFVISFFGYIDCSTIRFVF